MGPVFVSFIVVQYFCVNLAWIMSYFRHSFISPLLWEGRIDEFYNEDVLQKVDPIPGELSADGSSVLSYSSYYGITLIGETVGWSAFIWFLIWVSIFRGVGGTGRVVYWTMGLPIVTTIIFVGRALSLPDAAAGVRLVWATWRSSELASPMLWQRAVGQVFFSTGVGKFFLLAFRTRLTN
jgi:solute carrier family 6 GABA transporter-like protein 1